MKFLASPQWVGDTPPANFGDCPGHSAASNRRVRGTVLQRHHHRPHQVDSVWVVRFLQTWVDLGTEHPAPQSLQICTQSASMDEWEFDPPGHVLERNCQNGVWQMKLGQNPELHAGPPDQF